MTVAALSRARKSTIPGASTFLPTFARRRQNPAERPGDFLASSRSCANDGSTLRPWTGQFQETGGPSWSRIQTGGSRTRRATASDAHLALAPIALARGSEIDRSGARSAENRRAAPSRFSPRPSRRGVAKRRDTARLWVKRTTDEIDEPADLSAVAATGIRSSALSAGEDMHIVGPHRIRRESERCAEGHGLEETPWVSWCLSLWSSWRFQRLRMP